MTTPLTSRRIEQIALKWFHEVDVEHTTTIMEAIRNGIRDALAQSQGEGKGDHKELHNLQRYGINPDRSGMHVDAYGAFVLHQDVESQLSALKAELEAEGKHRMEDQEQIMSTMERNSKLATELLKLRSELEATQSLLKAMTETKDEYFHEKNQLRSELEQARAEREVNPLRFKDEIKDTARRIANDNSDRRRENAVGQIIDLLTTINSIRGFPARQLKQEKKDE